LKIAGRHYARYRAHLQTNHCTGMHKPGYVARDIAGAVMARTGAAGANPGLGVRTRFPSGNWGGRYFPAIRLASSAAMPV
jgi:hypothetical protein